MVSASGVLALLFCAEPECHVEAGRVEMLTSWWPGSREKWGRGWDEVKLPRLPPLLRDLLAPVDSAPGVATSS